MGLVSLGGLNFHQFKFKILRAIPVGFFCAALVIACREKATAPAVAHNAAEEHFDLFLDSLKNSGSTQMQTANEIRRYLAERIDLGESKDSLSENYYKIPWSDFSPFRCLELFQQNTLTAKCGLTSYILAKLYTHAGLKSYIYDCGYGNIKLTHEFVLVKIDDKLIVQDAFFNITIADTANNPKDFIEVLKELQNGNFDDVNVLQTTVLSESWVRSKAEFDSLVKNNQHYVEVYNKYVKEVTETDNRVRILLERNFNSFTALNLEKMKPRLKEDGLPENFLSIYLKPLHIKDGHSGDYEDSLETLIRAIVSN